MFAGHVGAALAIGRVDRRVNAGVFISTALLLDVALWLFVLLGWESVTIPGSFSRTRQAEFVFPYSHGLLASAAWSLAAGIAALIGYSGWKQGRSRAAALVAAAVFSHWLLDALVHVRELPLLGADSTKVGLGLWQSIPVALTLEAAIAMAGLYLFLSGSALPRSRKMALAALSLLILAFTVLGMTVAPAPPSAVAMAGSSLATLIVVVGLHCWLGRRQST